MLCFEVIFKSMTGPDNTCQVELKEWLGLLHSMCAQLNEDFLYDNVIYINLIYR